MGVQRQYTGTAGRIENSQVAVYLVSSAARGHAAIDRALYVPRSWTDDDDRCRAAGIPDGLGFATKPVLAARMVARALDAGTPARWVAGDEVYGDNPHHPAPDGLAPLTSNEIQHLFTTLIARPVHDALHRLRWSQWRRRHQARACKLPLPTAGGRAAVTGCFSWPV